MHDVIGQSFPELRELLVAIEQRLEVLALHADNGLAEVSESMGRLITSRNKIRATLAADAIDPTEGPIDLPVLFVAPLAECESRGQWGDR